MSRMALETRKGQRSRRRFDDEFKAQAVRLVLDGKSIAAVGPSAAVHVMPYLLGRGHSLGAASLVLAVMGAAQVPGRLLFAPLTRLLPERSFGPGVFLVQAIGLICLAFAGSSLTSALLFAVVFGAGSGLTTLVRPLVVAEWFGVVLASNNYWCEHARNRAPHMPWACIARRFLLSLLA
jgi:predicted MFS family arabinose efflux permease